MLIGTFTLTFFGYTEFYSLVSKVCFSALNYLKIALVYALQRWQEQAFADNYFSLLLGNKLVMTIFSTSVCSSISEISSLDLAVPCTGNIMSCYLFGCQSSSLLL